MGATNPNAGYNAATDKFEDLMEAGIIDPTKVRRFLRACQLTGLIAWLVVMPRGYMETFAFNCIRVRNGSPSACESLLAFELTYRRMHWCTCPTS